MQSINEKHESVLRTYVNDMVALERDIANAIEGQHSDGHVEAKPDAPPSNQRAELEAVFRALEFVRAHIDDIMPRHVVLISDSEYALKCVNEWINAWTANPSRLIGKKNLDLIYAAKAELDALKARYPGFQVVGTTAHHEKTLSEVDFTKPTMLLIGNETEGLRRIYKERSDVLATIPMNPRGSASSFNVACAATVMFYEAVRQRAAATCRGEVAGGAC